ncbi:hypothetical protein FHX68_2755 [Microbacterium lacticum]|uniref:Uncharacterized protein n=1 Tax=Microbacterium lacticum TaxID=33885 RepID=A0A543K742_9MICO|nr:hypothetical protein FHX68_2755 [Microbacterium lacticum]
MRTVPAMILLTHLTLISTIAIALTGLLYALTSYL